MRGRLQNTTGREVKQFKSDKYGSESAIVQNSANNCWVVLAVWTHAISARRHIFCQDMSSVPRGPHAASKALGRSQRWQARWRKPAFDSKIRKICRPFYQDHPYAIASGPRHHLTAFHIKNHDFAIAEVLINLRLILSCAELWVMIRWQAMSMATGGLPIPTTKFALSLGSPPSGFIHLSATTATAAGRKKQPTIDSPTLYVQ
jgi:hypothetical protein